MRKLAEQAAVSNHRSWLTIWIISIAIVVAILAVSVWASGRRDANDVEVTADWGRGPTDGGGLGGF